MKKNLTWRIISELHRLYIDDSIKTKDYVINHIFTKHLESFGHISVGRKNIISSLPSYKPFYEVELLENYKKYLFFLEKHNLLEPTWNFKEDDILTLMLIDNNKEKIIEAEQTKNQISSFYFRNEDAKYLRKSISLSNAILRITGLTKFPEDEKDQQYLIFIPCKNPSAILLCENIDKIRLPDKYVKANIELWYSGGRNISKLANIRENEKLPFFYICDWDHDGLDIYRSIKREYIPELILVSPDNSLEARKPIGTHKSLWKEINSYNLDLFEASQQLLITDLIKSNDWIEEESVTFNYAALRK